jgi:hypothetical protein
MRQKGRQVAGGGAGFWLIPNIGTFLSKSFGYLPVVSTIAGNEKNHAISIT